MLFGSVVSTTLVIVVTAQVRFNREPLENRGHRKYFFAVVRNGLWAKSEFMKGPN